MGVKKEDITMGFDCRWCGKGSDADLIFTYKTESKRTEMDPEEVIRVLNALVKACLDLGHQPCVVNKYIVNAIKEK